MREIFTHKQGIKYYIVLEVEFHKPIGDIISDPPPVFRSAIYSLLRSEIEDIEELEDQIDDAIRKLKNDIDEFTENGSGWIFTKYIKLLVKMFDYEAIKGYDMHHILKNLNGRNAKIIANSKEKIMTAQIGGHSEENEEGRNTNTNGIKYIDSFAFLSTSLATLANNLPKEDFISMKKYLHDEITRQQYPGIPRNEGERVTELERERQNMFEPGVACKDPLKNGDVLDYRNWKITPKRALTEAEDADVKKAFDLLTRKGVYPYDWVDSIEKMQETCLPPKEAFYNKLYDSSISDEDYTYAQQVWQFFKCQTFQDYHELYLKTDVLLLADVFESFRKQSLKFYKLDPAHYLTAPSLAWDAMLKMTGVTLELLSEEKKDIHLMIEDGIRGGVSIA
eukprot:gene2657-biopygen2200